MKKTIEFSFAVVMFFVMHFAPLQQQLLTLYGLSLFAWLLAFGLFGNIGADGAARFSAECCWLDGFAHTYHGSNRCQDRIVF